MSSPCGSHPLLSITHSLPSKPCLTLRLASFSVSHPSFPPSLEHHLRLDYTGLVVRHPHRTRWPVSSPHRLFPSSRAGAAVGPLNSNSTIWAKFYPRLINTNSSSAALEVLGLEEDLEAVLEELAGALGLIYRSRIPRPSRRIYLISKSISI